MVGHECLDDLNLGDYVYVTVGQSSAITVCGGKFRGIARDDGGRWFNQVDGFNPIPVLSVRAIRTSKST